MRMLCLLVLAGCGSTGTRASFPVPAEVTALPADGCGQFELVADKGTDRARAAVDVRARCDNSYICSPRVAGNRVELHGVGPGTTNLHLELVDPDGGNQAANVKITVVPAKSTHSGLAAGGCSYIPVRR